MISQKYQCYTTIEFKDVLNEINNMRRIIEAQTIILRNCLVHRGERTRYQSNIGK